MYVCDQCDRAFAQVVGLAHHRRSCVGRDWACGWCQTTQSKSKCKGPDGLATLCLKCGIRFHQGHTGPAPELPTNADGMYECDRCDRTFASSGALATHRRSCGGRDWACGWCHATQSKSKCKGPDGPATLCNKCGKRFRRGHTGPAPELPTNADGLYECDRCDRTFAQAGSLASHRRSCAGRDWACGWCHATQSKIKCKGPDGPATLCDKCGSRFRWGHTGPAPELPTNADGMYAVSYTHLTLPTILLV